MSDIEALRADMIDGWEQTAAGWGRMADRLRAWGMPVSAWLIDHLDLQPGETVLELAAGPGDTGFLAAELIQPGGRLISSDAAEAMLEVARRRAAAAGLPGVEFRRLQLEWIDQDTASVDAILCRWGVMLVVDPAAALGEMRRVVKPGGRAALAVWDDPGANPWAAIPMRTLVELGLTEPPDPSAPGMFSLAAPGRLSELLEDAGFTEVLVDAVELVRQAPSVEDFLAETETLSGLFGRVFRGLDGEGRRAVKEKATERLAPYLTAEGGLELPGRSLVALARA